MARALLGEDGLGYELARRLDDCGTWHAWLGDTSYTSFAPSLSSLSAWKSFLSSKSPPSLVRLQLRVRALLYDKASVALDLGHSPSDLSDINPSYLKLHGDDVYYSLEDAEKDSYAKMHSRSSSSSTHYLTMQMPSRSSSSSTSPSKSDGSYSSKNSSAGSTGIVTESTSVQEDEHDDLPVLWYDRFIDKYRRHLKFPFEDWDLMKRTPEGMSSYLKHAAMHKRRRIAFKDDKTNGTLNQEMMEDDVLLIPELMYPLNCVPERTVGPSNSRSYEKK